MSKSSDALAHSTPLFDRLALGWALAEVLDLTLRALASRSSASCLSPGAGDPFVGARRREDRCHCYDGWHYIGYVVELPDGDEDVEYKRVPRKRCNDD
jgi:hypothetical protein